MVATASAGGDQDPPQGSGTGAENSTHVSTSTQGAQEIPGPTGSRSMDSSQVIPENNTSTTGTNPVSISTTAPSSLNAGGMQFASTNAGNQLFTPGSSVFEWRTNSQYGMPNPYMTGTRGAGPTYTINPTAFSPNVGSVGRSAQNT